MMSNSWKKFGEVFKNVQDECVFVCVVCMQPGQHFNLTYSTSDASAFSKHIQHHVSRDCEFMKEPPAIKRQKELQQQHCDISYANDSSIEKNAESTDLDKVHRIQNNKHESIVDNFGKSEEDKEPKQLQVKIEVEQIQLQDMIMESEPSLKVETAHDNFIQSNLEETKRNINMLDNLKQENIQNNAFSLNYEYNHNQEIYEISDDDDAHDKEDGNDQSAKNYLAHNDMIELSDDNDEEDESNTLPTSSQLNMEHMNNSEKKHLGKVNSRNSCNSGYSYNCLQCHIIFSDRNELLEHLETHELEASALATCNSMNPLDSIQTPEVSPNDNVVLNQNFNKNVQLYQCHYCPQRFFEARQLDLHQRLHLPKREGKRKFKSRPFQCNACGKRTSTEEAMLIHQRRFHSSESDFETSHCELCKKRVLTTNLQQHMLVHTEFRYKCNNCDQTYKQKQTLRKHINKYHPYATMDMNPSIPINTYEVARETYHIHQERSQPLDSLQVSQSRLTPEEYKIMYSLFLHSHSQNQNKDPTTASVTSNGSMDVSNYLSKSSTEHNS